MLNKKAISNTKNTLYKYRESFIFYFLRGKIMNEQQLSIVLGTISEPIKNAYKLSSRKQIEEIQRIIRIFNINKEQKNKHTMLSIKNLATMKVVYSNN